MRKKIYIISVFNLCSIRGHVIYFFLRVLRASAVNFCRCFHLLPWQCVSQGWLWFNAAKGVRTAVQGSFLRG